MVTKTFRFDDICLNSDMKHVRKMTNFLIGTFTQPHIMWAISPLVQDPSVAYHGVYAPILKAYSDNTLLYRNDKLGIPDIPPDLKGHVTVISHGLVHADHRLMCKGAQELSILASTSLLQTDIFLPPFNHWNDDTEDICTKHGIKLIKFEDGWRSLEHEPFRRNEIHKWYLHDRNMTFEDFKAKLT
jgi:hypothetical protein